MSTPEMDLAAILANAEAAYAWIREHSTGELPACVRQLFNYEIPMLLAHRAQRDRTSRQVADFDDAAIRAAEGHSPELPRQYVPTPRTQAQINAIHGRNAVVVYDDVDAIQDAHHALWESMTGRERTDAQRVLDQVTDKTGEAASEG